MRNYVNLAVPTMPLLVADKRGAAETKIIASYCEQIFDGNQHETPPPKLWANYTHLGKSVKVGHFTSNVSSKHLLAEGEDTPTR
jgi:hypothetical protein